MKPENSMLDSFNNSALKCSICKEYFDKEKQNVHYTYLLKNKLCINCAMTKNIEYYKATVRRGNLFKKK